MIQPWIRNLRIIDRNGQKKWEERERLEWTQQRNV